MQFLFCLGKFPAHQGEVGEGEEEGEEVLVDEEEEEEVEVGESESGESFKCQCSQKVSSMKVRGNIQEVLVKFSPQKSPY